MAAAQKAAPARKITALKEAMTKTQIVNEIAENTGLTKKDINNVFDELGIVMERHIKKRGVGFFTMLSKKEVCIGRKI